MPGGDIGVDDGLGAEYRLSDSETKTLENAKAFFRYPEQHLQPWFTDTVSRDTNGQLHLTLIEELCSIWSEDDIENRGEPTKENFAALELYFYMGKLFEHVLSKATPPIGPTATMKEKIKKKKKETRDLILQLSPDLVSGWKAKANAQTQLAGLIQSLIGNGDFLVEQLKVDGVEKPHLSSTDDDYYASALLSPSFQSLLSTWAKKHPGLIRAAAGPLSSSSAGGSGASVAGPLSSGDADGGDEDDAGSTLDDSANIDRILEDAQNIIDKNDWQDTWFRDAFGKKLLEALRSLLTEYRKSKSVVILHMMELYEYLASLVHVTNPTVGSRLTHVLSLSLSDKDRFYDSRVRMQNRIQKLLPGNIQLLTPEAIEDNLTGVVQDFAGLSLPEGNPQPKLLLPLQAYVNAAKSDEVKGVFKSAPGPSSSAAGGGGPAGGPSSSTPPKPSSSTPPKPSSSTPPKPSSSTPPKPSSSAPPKPSSSAPPPDVFEVDDADFFPEPKPLKPPKPASAPKVNSLAELKVAQTDIDKFGAFLLEVSTKNRTKDSKQQKSTHETQLTPQEWTELKQMAGELLPKLLIFIIERPTPPPEIVRQVQTYCKNMRVALESKAFEKLQEEIPKLKRARPVLINLLKRAQDVYQSWFTTNAKYDAACSAHKAGLAKLKKLDQTCCEIPPPRNIANIRAEAGKLGAMLVPPTDMRYDFASFMPVGLTILTFSPDLMKKETGDLGRAELAAGMITFMLETGLKEPDLMDDASIAYSWPQHLSWKPWLGFMFELFRLVGKMEEQQKVDGHNLGGGGAGGAEGAGGGFSSASRPGYSTALRPSYPIYQSVWFPSPSDYQQLSSVQWPLEAGA